MPRFLMSLDLSLLSQAVSSIRSG